MTEKLRIFLSFELILLLMIIIINIINEHRVVGSLSRSKKKTPSFTVSLTDSE